MLLHDASDPVMELAKISLYCGKTFLANLFFVLFSMLFITTRDFIYPICVISPLFYADEASLVRYVEVYIAALSTIGLLNLFWSYLILSMVKRHIATGNVQGDIRE
jgi:hypothetical protein